MLMPHGKLIFIRQEKIMARTHAAITARATLPGVRRSVMLLLLDLG
jgi:hypothetical protein